jgi:NADH dehydrogenase
MQSSLEKFPMNQARGHRIQTRENPGNKSLVGRPRVVVLGAGFAGLWAARTLADGPVNVILIDRYNHHTFFPLLYQVATAELEPGAIAQPLRKIFWKKSNVHFYLGEVLDINFSAKIVRIPDHEIPYDYLVVALGSKPNYYGIPGAADYAFPLKSLEQGLLLRNQILSSFERAACEENSEVRQSKLTFTIVGGGPTGVAFAGTLTELINGSLSRDFPNLDFKKVRVLLIEAADCLIPDMPKHLSDYTEARLQKMGVGVHLQSQVVKITPSEVFLKDGTRIASQTVIWTAGVRGNIPGDGWGLATNLHNQVDVLPTLQVPGYPEAYVVGDLAGIQQDGQPLPMVSQVGIQTGSAAAKNILTQVAGQTPLPFRYHDKGAIDVIGRNAAVARMWGVSFSGFVAWVIWAVLHIYRLIGFRNRLILMINWAWDYLFREHGVRLIVPSEASLSQVSNVRESSKQRDVFAGVNHPQEAEGSIAST